MGTKTLPWLVMGHGIAVSSKDNSCNTSPLHSALQSQHYFGGNKCFWLCVWVVIQKSLWRTSPPPAPPPGEPCAPHPTPALTPVPLCLTRGWQGTEGSPSWYQREHPATPFQSVHHGLCLFCAIRATMQSWEAWLPLASGNAGTCIYSRLPGARSWPQLGHAFPPYVLSQAVSKPD